MPRGQPWHHKTRVVGTEIKKTLPWCFTQVKIRILRSQDKVFFFHKSIWQCIEEKCIQSGAVKLVLWRHWMHLNFMHQVILENQFHCTRLYSCTPDNSWIFTGRHFVAPDITHVLVRRLLHPYGDQVQCIQSTDVCPARWLQNTVRQITLPTKLAR